MSLPDLTPDLTVEVPEALRGIRRVSLQVHVVLEVTDDVTDFLYPDNLDDAEDLTLDQLKATIEGDFAGFVANEVNNNSDYPVRVAAIFADVTEVSA